MKRMFIFFLLLAGCTSDPMDSDSQLPWNRPAPWERKRDISTSLQFHKKYKPKYFDERSNQRKRVKITFGEERGKMEMKGHQGNDFDVVHSQVVRNESSFSFENQRRDSIEVSKTYPEEPNIYNFRDKE